MDIEEIELELIDFGLEEIEEDVRLLRVEMIRLLLEFMANLHSFW